MRLSYVASIDAESSGPLFVMFHGYGNDEHEMIRVAEAMNNGTGKELNYLSFRGPVTRPYLGGAYWYPDGCGVEERRQACSQVGDAVAALLDSSTFRRRRIILMGFSQGGYLSYRIVREHPGLADTAVLLSPSFKGEESAEPPSGNTRFVLVYGDHDTTIPLDDQANALRVLEANGRCTALSYPAMAHSICDEEIVDLRRVLGI